MGLDMYLKAKNYLSNFDFAESDKELNTKIKEVLGLEHLNDGDASIEVAVNVAYWRKANAIHAWFVEHCQDGRDECQESYVDREQLQELLDLCEKALIDKDADLLPPQSGFFFGSTEINEWYWDDLEHTAKVLSAILNDEKLERYSFYYQSSW
jgi:hypothetical protein